MVEEQKMRIEMYQLLVELLAEPSQDFADMYAEATACYMDVCQHYHVLASKEIGWPEKPASLAEWQQLHYRSFVMPPKDRLVAVESIYRQWTYDKSCGLTIAREKGHLMSDSAMHMLKLYQEYGIELPAVMSQQPDHLLLELEFMGILVEQGDLSRQRLFLQEHLNWVEELYDDARCKQIPPYYQQVIGLVCAWLKAESSKLDSE